MEEHGIEGFRSPSWYTSPQLWRALKRMGFCYDMSVVDSWPFFDRSRNFGVASIFPFRYGGLTIVPNTISYDGPPRIAAIASERSHVLEAKTGLDSPQWRSDHAKRAPRPVVVRHGQGSGNARKSCRLCVGKSYSRGNEGARGLRAGIERICGARTVILSGEPDLEIPVHGTSKMADAKHVRNPLLLRREDFLKNRLRIGFSQPHPEDGPILNDRPTRVSDAKVLRSPTWVLNLLASGREGCW